ncbi:hypothetical protein J7438_09900 [Thalassotalea sp. G20_0]|uniref:hypothetical protein n=1 Tax=Thalassotalea sp. G20_0 TaxID=2821093 RepID=UPI001ADC42C8|nr:hypothetical protein [Thalassotalea sp. G20_0]MBO9494395.1 hypothetical protein [Thalassotalea sp. G20_0]
MSPISSHFSMFHEFWGDDENVARDRQSSKLFWRHGTGHKTFTTDSASNRLIEQATVDHVGCCLVSFDSGKRKVAPLNPDTRLLFRHQLPDESFLEPGKIKELSDRNIIVLHGFSELHDAQAFEHHLRVRSYYNDDGSCILDEFPKWPSADQMASYGFVFSEIQVHGPEGKACVDMDSIWQSKLWTNFAIDDMKRQDADDLKIEDIYSDSCRFTLNVDKQQYLAELNAARRQPVLQLNHKGLKNNNMLTPVSALRSVVQTEDASLPELQLIMPADFDILPRSYPEGFAAPTGPVAVCDPSFTIPVFRSKEISLVPQVKQPIKSYPFSPVEDSHLADSSADSDFATLKFAGASVTAPDFSAVKYTLVKLPSVYVNIVVTPMAP